MTRRLDAPGCLDCGATLNSRASIRCRPCADRASLGRKKSPEHVRAVYRAKFGFDNREERFWSLVDKSVGPDACWPWGGYVGVSGYGAVSWDTTTKLAHRVAFALASGTWPSAAEEVMHSCDNPPCVNPAHLSVGTHADNMRDMAKRGRSRMILTLEQARVIHQMAQSQTRTALAIRYGVSRTTISHILAGRRWPESGPRERIA